MKNISIGLFGFGCVGKGLYQTLNQSKNFAGHIAKIGIKDPTKKRELPSHLFTTDAQSIIEDPKIDIIVELIDDAAVALDIVVEALKAGKSVVTANKKMVAENMQLLVDLQKQTGKAVLYEGAVCASIPIIRNLEEYFGHEPLTEVKGIFNGSTNYILSRVFHDKMDYETALAQAQSLGFAESDPALDVEGFDAKYKLSILISHTFGIHVHPDEVLNLGIHRIKPADLEYAYARSWRIKLIGHAQRVEDKIYAFVMPRFVPITDNLATTENEYNAVVINGEFCDNQWFTGKGAGSLPTGAAVLSDVSALSYDYKYEYKKESHKEQLIFSNDSPVKVYASFQSPEDVLLNDFDQVVEKYFSYDYCYVVGTICLNKLKHKEWQNNPHINVVLTTDKLDNSLGKLCVNQLKEEIGELKKSQKLRKKLMLQS